MANKNSFASLEPEDRREAIKTIAKAHGLNVLIETGTNQGLTPLHLKDDFATIYTIELHQGLFRAARDKLAPYPNIHCNFGDSTVVLPAILKELTEPALVWLDGHYSGEGTAHGEQSTPVREELRVLFEDARPHVILVDDARIFKGGPEEDLYEHYETYPSLEWVEEQAKANGYDYKLANDIIRLTPCS